MKFLWHKKYSITLVLVFALMITGSAFAQDKENKDILSLSLTEALKLAEENNQRVHLSKLALEKAELERQEFRYGNRKARKQEDGNWQISKDFDTDYQKEVTGKIMDLGVEMAEMGINATVRNIRFSVESAYYNAISAKDNVKIAEASLARQKDMLKIAEAKLKAGTVAKKDVLDAQVELAKAEGNLLQAKSQEEKAYINLKQLLGISLDRTIELTDSFEYKPIGDKLKLEQIIEDAKEQRMDMIKVKGDVEVAQLDFDWISKVYTSNTFKYKEKEHALQESITQLSDKTKEVEAEVRSIWLDLNEASANIPVLDKSLEMAEESLRLAKLSYEAGVIRSVDVAAAEEGLRQVELNRTQVIFNYNLAKLKLENVQYIPVM